MVEARYTFHYVHIFLHVHAAKLEEEYEITYVLENELINGKNLLHSVTNSPAHEHVANYYGVAMSFQNRHLQTTLSQLKNYSVGIKMSREGLEHRLLDIKGKVEDVRYICLIKRINPIKPICDYLNILSYTSIKSIVISNDTNCSTDKETDFKSKYVTFPFENPFKRHFNAIIDKLMLNPMDTYHGISVVC